MANYTKQEEYLFDFLIDMANDMQEWRRIYPDKEIKEVAIDARHWFAMFDFHIGWLVFDEGRLFFDGVELVIEERWAGDFHSIRSTDYMSGRKQNL